MLVPRITFSVQKPDPSKLPDKALSIKLIALLAMSAMMACAGCAAWPSSSSVLSSQISRDNHITVTVTPDTAVLTPNQKQRFMANVTGTPNTAVTWSASTGSINNSGLYTAPASSKLTDVTITAVSRADTRRRASVLVRVQSSSALAKPSILTTLLAQAEVGSSYSQGVSVSGGAEPYRWRVVSGTIPIGLMFSSDGQLSGIPTRTGTFYFGVSVSDSDNSTAEQTFSLSVVRGSNFDGPAELPRVYLNTAFANTPAPGAITQVNAGGNLQGALDEVKCGDTITLQAGSTFIGAFHLRSKPCDDQHWIIIRTNAPDSALPAEGIRISPCYAGVRSLAGRPAFNCPVATKVMAQIIGMPHISPISLDSGANHYRLIGIEITRPEASGVTMALVQPNGTADHVIFDRVWLHGTTHDDTARGIYLEGVTNSGVIDSYFTDFHCTSMIAGCTDSQDIAGGVGDLPQGPYKITNNFLEAAAESIMFGGSRATSTPTDIEIRRNHLFKPITWLPGQPGFVGGNSGYPFIVKNHFELKNAVRVLFEGNILENTWGGFSQAGYSILLTPVNQGGHCPECRVTDVTIRYNTISHVGAGLQLANPLSGTTLAQALYGERYSIHDMIIDDVQVKQYKGAGTIALIANGWSRNVLNSISINHITAFSDYNLLNLVDLTSHPKMWGFIFTNNLVLTGKYPVWSGGGGSSNCAASDQPTLSLNTCFAGYTFAHNALIAPPAAFGPSKWPSGNLFPAEVSDVGFASYSVETSINYELLPTSPFSSAGTDGKPIGADVAAINAAITGVY